MNPRAFCIAVAVGVVTPSLVHDTRAVGDDWSDQPRLWSASRDAPVFEFAYGPRAQLSLGHDLPLYTGNGEVGMRAAISALVALENADDAQPLADELARIVISAGATWSLDHLAQRLLGKRGVLELGGTIGFERARELVGTESDRLMLTPRPGDIPFGGGGGWIGASAAVDVPVRGSWRLVMRANERMFWNAFPLVIGNRSASDTVANTVGEGLAHAPSVELALRGPQLWCMRPLVALYVEGLLPHDQSADASYFARALLGAGLPRSTGAWGLWLPFVSIDAGSGKGLLVNRHELRLSVGVRYAM